MAGEVMWPKAAGWARDLPQRTFVCRAGHLRRSDTELERCMTRVGFGTCLEPMEEIDPDELEEGRP